MSATGRIPTTAERAALASGSPPAGLCARCEHLRLLASKSSVFVRCGRAEEDPRFTRYPGLPVHACPGYQPTPPS